MTETTVGREPIQIVEILQPLCANTYGSAPCTATGGPDAKCYNTRATCQDAANFALGTPLSLFFANGAVAARNVPGADYIIPSLKSVSTAPTAINLAGAKLDAQGLGNRAVCNITLIDHPHSDRRVDPYLSGRSWNPMERASFWTKWLVRNKYRQNVQIRVYEGYAGQALSEMTRRTYFLQEVAGPDDSGRISIQGKDILAKLEERKAQAPVASPGVLYTDITAAATSFEVTNAVIGDYAASGTLRIRDEIMTYTSRSSSTNGVTFSGVTRATDNTTATTHSAEDAVQQCLRYTAQAVDTILSDLLTTYGGISSGWLDTTNWATEVGDYLPLYNLTTLITEPTAVGDLVSEVQEQTLLYIWWDERDALVKLKAIRGIDAVPPRITDEDNIIAGSFRLTEMPRQRASQVWIYYARQDFIKSHTSPAAYAVQSVVADLESETAVKYGEASIRKIFARWLPSGALAETTASKIITRYVDVPSECTFRMDAKDRSYWVGDTLTISHFLDVDEFGNRRERNWTITSAEEVVPGETAQYRAEDTTLYGRIHYIMGSGEPDYPGADLVAFKNCYIGNSAGLLSDGTTCGRIA